MTDKYWHLVVFKDGKRIDKRVSRTMTSDVKKKVIELRKRGVKCHVVGRTAKRTYPPQDEVLEKRAEGMLWCPYCGEWRWFTTPKRLVRDAPVMSDAWYENSYFRQGIKRCNWCRISVYDFYVGVSNGIFAEVRGSKRRRRARKSKTRTRR